MLRLQLNIDVNKNKIPTTRVGFEFSFSVISPLLRFFFYLYIFSCVGCDYNDVMDERRHQFSCTFIITVSFV